MSSSSQFKMKQREKIFIIVGTLIILVSTLGLFSIDKLFSPIAWFVGVNTVFITIASAHVGRKNSTKLFGAYLGVFLLAYAIVDYVSAGEVKLLIFTYDRSLAITLRSVIYYYLTGFAVFGLFYQGDFLTFKRKIAFKLAVILLVVFFLIQLPIYDIHGDFGGHSHGHPLWKGFHFH